MRLAFPVLLLAALSPTASAGAPDIVFADFEGDTYGEWKTTGTAFGTGPARGTLPGQMPVSGFRGKGLVNSYLGGDAASGGWGHINVDHIVFTDRKPPLPVARPARDIEIVSHYLFFPVKNGAAKRKVGVSVADKVERHFDIELADGKADWWAFLDVAEWRGKTLTVRVDKLTTDSTALAAIDQGDELKGGADLYREALRPQLHFSPRRGWTNDPNGLVSYRGEYHLFFQHNPYGWSWGNMHWGHAVSKDLVHWEEQQEALYPDAMGPIFSGSAVVDWGNTSGLGEEGKPPLVLVYTAAGNPTVQCLASSMDGRTFTKYAGNPVVKQITGGNRDPKVFWHEPSKRWVMTLYVGIDKKHTIHILTTPNLKDWTVRSVVDGFYECPDLFELAVGGDAAEKKWVLTAASSEYRVGSFDGEKFTPETPKLPGQRGRGFYAAQTFSDIPSGDGRRIQIGWLQAPSPGMPFNQALSVPMELKLARTSDGLRLTWTPVRELEKLRTKTTRAGGTTLDPGADNPLAGASGELLEIVAVFEPKKAVVAFNVRGVIVRYDGAKEELEVEGLRVPAPLREGKADLRILTDRTAFEMFASGGRTYVPLPVIARADNRSVEVSVKEDTVRFAVLDVHELRSIWAAVVRGPGR
jgi:fructan beta-fructosidase